MRVGPVERPGERERVVQPSAVARRVAQEPPGEPRRRAGRRVWRPEGPGVALRERLARPDELVRAARPAEHRRPVPLVLQAEPPAVPAG